MRKKELNSVFKNENSHKITLFLPPAANIHPKICTGLKKNHCSFYFTLPRALLHTILPPASTGCDSISEKPTPFPHPPQYAISDGGFAASVCRFALPLRRPGKNRFAEKELRLLQTGQYRVRRPVGELLFWGFSVAMIWRWDDSGGLPGLFGFRPKSGGFVVQKRT